MSKKYKFTVSKGTVPFGGEDQVVAFTYIYESL
jgi:hypothetical protein